MIRALFKTSRRKRARKAYAEAKAAADQAEARRDTRSIHETRKALGDAMTELLKAETVRVVRR